MERLTLFCRWSKVNEARLKSCPSRSRRFPNPQRDGVVESRVSQKTRDMGHPRVVVASANSRFLTGLSARFGMTRVFKMMI
jgi:hypothetical protein